uniref:hypothetical protein n=1 Tax=uncultured Draconibacterium sp. TaxID=1573823 RepID=UPI003216503E
MNINQENNSASQKKFESKSDQITVEILADKVLSTLDIMHTVPDNLIDKVVARKESVEIESYTKFDLSKYLQIAAVFAAAVCIGIIMGKNADVHSFNKKQNQKEQALIELRERHHLSDLNTFGRL